MMNRTGKRKVAVLLVALLLIGGFFEMDAERVHATASTRKKLQEAEEEKNGEPDEEKSEKPEKEGRGAEARGEWLELR